jgi:hypothetical protein
MPTTPALRGLLAFALILTLFLVLVACGQAPATPSVSPSEGRPASAPQLAPVPLPSPAGETTAVHQPDGTFLFTPGSARVLAGVLYSYVAMTHCGFTPTTIDFDGSFWTVANAAGGEGNPPPGIGNPEDAGTIALLGPNEAVFTSQSGILVPLRRAEGPQVGFPCD